MEQLPSPSTIEDAFGGDIVRRYPERNTVVFRIEDEEIDVGYDADEGIVDFINVDRPTVSRPLWDGIFRLLSDFDLFLYWPGVQLIAAVARPDVPCRKAWTPSGLGNSVAPITRRLTAHDPVALVA